MEGRVLLVAGRPVGASIFRPHGRLGRLAVELLVPPVAPAADPLREQEARRDRVHEVADAGAGAAHDDAPARPPNRIPPQTPRPPCQTAKSPTTSGSGPRSSS